MIRRWTTSKRCGPLFIGGKTVPMIEDFLNVLERTLGMDMGWHYDVGQSISDVNVGDIVSVVGSLDFDEMDHEEKSLWSNFIERWMYEK